MGNVTVSFTREELEDLEELLHQKLTSLRTAPPAEQAKATLVRYLKVADAARRAGGYSEPFEYLPEWALQIILALLLPKPPTPAAKKTAAPKKPSTAQRVQQEFDDEAVAARRRSEQARKAGLARAAKARAQQLAPAGMR